MVYLTADGLPALAGEVSGLPHRAGKVTVELFVWQSGACAGLAWSLVS